MNSSCNGCEALGLTVKANRGKMKRTCRKQAAKWELKPISLVAQAGEEYLGSSSSVR